jgi:hypothetical protein
MRACDMATYWATLLFLMVMDGYFGWKGWVGLSIVVVSAVDIEKYDNYLA